MRQCKFIREYVDARDFDVLTESTERDEIMKIVGPYIFMNGKNNNGRTYTEGVIDPAVDEYKRLFIDTANAVGEMNHPDSVKVNYKEGCHTVLNMRKEGNYYIGESQVLRGLPCGDILYGLLKNNVRPGMSTRGVGEVDEATGNVKSYKMFAVDVVSDPSGHGCFVETLKESKEYMINTHGLIVERAYDALEEQLTTLPNRFDEKKSYIQNVISQFMKSI